MARSKKMIIYAGLINRDHVLSAFNDVVDGDADLTSLAALALNPGSDGFVSIREALIAANLEITESMLMGNIEHFAKLLHEINDLGVSISLDDFGTGYSSLNYLKKFPINELKIDKSFLTDVPASKEDNLIVKAIIAMSHGLGQKVVAEGVENEAQLAFLKALNCDIIQGYYFSKPLNKADFSNYLSLNAS